MIPNVGKNRLLTYQQSGLSACYWCLFTNNETLDEDTVWGDLTEAAWSGYARVSVSSLTTPAIETGRSVTRPVSQPTFTNTSGSTQSFYGWALLDTSDNTIIAVDNIGSTDILNGSGYALNTQITDTEEVVVEV